MKLLFYNFKERNKVISLTNIELSDFFNFIGLEMPIKISSFYGYNSSKYFYESDLSEELNLKILLSFILDNRINIINNIQFDINNISVKITDCHQFDIEGEQISTDYLKKVVYHFMNFSIDHSKNFTQFENKYTLIDKGKVVKAFNTFDEYLESEFSV